MYILQSLTKHCIYFILYIIQYAIFTSRTYIKCHFMIVKRTYLLKVDNNEQKNILLIPILSLHSLSYNRHVFFKRPQTQVKIQKFFLYYNRKWVFILGAEINHVLVVNHQKYDVKLQEKSILQNVHCTLHKSLYFSEYHNLYFIYILLIFYIF